MHMLPMPGGRDLLAAWRTEAPPDEELTSPWRRAGEMVWCLSRSAWSLQAVAEWRQSFTLERRIRFWVPDYFCNQSLAGVRAAGAELVFYSLQDSLAPDWARCTESAAIAPPDVFLLVHYFGIESDVEAAHGFAQMHGALLVEDCAHALLPTGRVGSRGDFVLFSPHKLLPIPDGAILAARSGAMKKVGGQPGDFEASFGARLTQLPSTAASSSRWVSRRLAARCLPRWLTRSRSGLDFPSSSSAPGLPWPARTSPLARGLLLRKLPELEAIGWRRCDNAERYRMWSRSIPEVEFIGTPFAKGFPFLTGLRFASESAALAFRRDARNAACPVMTWPDLPPEVLAQPAHHADAIKRLRTTVFLSVQQQLSAEQVVRRLGGRILVTPLSGAIRLEWDVEVGAWDALFRSAPQSSHLQSRAYTQAWAQQRGWKARHGALSVAGHRFGLFVVLEKRGPFGLTLARLNRGPVWLDANGSEEQQRAAVQLLAAHYAPRRGRALLAAPNLRMTPAAVLELTAAGWRRRSMRPWQSIWLDLAPDEKTLHARLDGKWRNQLASAQKKCLQLEVTTEKAAFDWLLERHAELIQGRGFSGPTPAFLRDLHRAMGETGDTFHVLRAVADGAWVAGIGVMQHGTTGTYLIGWNGPEGRRLNANNFLVWHAVLTLRRAGCSWFELGGVDEWRTPGITAFKRGLGGDEYRLIGDFRNFG